MIGTSITAFGKSKHSGQSGIVVADWGNMLLIKADDESYSGAHKNSGREGKYFQLDSRFLTSAKGKKNVTKDK